MRRTPNHFTHNFLLGLAAGINTPQSVCLGAVEAHLPLLNAYPCSPERVSPAPSEDPMARKCGPLDRFHRHSPVPDLLVDRFPCDRSLRLPHRHRQSLNPPHHTPKPSPCQMPLHHHQPVTAALGRTYCLSPSLRHWYRHLHGFPGADRASRPGVWLRPTTKRRA